MWFMTPDHLGRWCTIAGVIDLVAALYTTLKAQQTILKLKMLFIEKNHTEVLTYKDSM